MKTLCVIAVVLTGILLALPAVAQQTGAPIVAVFDIEDTRPAKTRLSDRERADLTAFLSAALTEGGAFRVVPPEQAGFADWKLANDLYHYLGETWRNFKKDAVRAAAYHQKAVDVSEDKSDWPAFWSEYILGYMAYEQGNADRALECFSLSRPNIHRMDWIYQNDFNYFWGETLRALKKDPAGARPFYQQCLKVSQNLGDWPAYWCMFRLGEMLRDGGLKEQAAEAMLRAEAAGRAEAGFAAEVDKALREMGKR